MQGSMFLSGQSLASRSHVCSIQRLQPQAPCRTVSRPQSLTVENRVVIRFQRYGRKKLPFYRIVAIDSRTKRNGVPCEVSEEALDANGFPVLKIRLSTKWLGWYNPLSKETNLNAPAIKKWLSVGAKPSEAAARILKKAMVIDPDISKADLA